MKTKNLKTDEQESVLPLSFKKKEVSTDKIKSHWEKIAAKLKNSNSANKTDQ